MAPSRPVMVTALLFLWLRCVASQGISSDSAIERSALLDLRSTLGLKSHDWPVKGSPCANWTGIACRGGRVVGVTISGLRRTRLGRMNPQFAVDGLRNLSSLETFNASGFSLPGSVPEWLGLGVPSLRVLDLRSCDVTGALPDTLGNLSMLKYLYLSDNSISGSINPQLGQLKQLLVLEVGRNLLTGSIPASFSSLSSLTWLDLSSNFITGSIPPGLGNVSELQLLNLSDNRLAASIPRELSELSRLVVLDLSKNSFSGALPERFFSKLVNLEGADLSQNKLDGALTSGSWLIPGSRFLDFSLATFNFSNNMLYGDLNSSLMKKSFTVIDLSGNYFRGDLRTGSPTNVSNATLLASNCLRSVPGQRSLAECIFFYSERGLVFDDVITPGLADQEPACKSTRRKKRKFILLGVFGGLGFAIILASVLVLIAMRCRRGNAKQRGSSEIGPAPEGGFRVVGYAYEQLVRATGNFSEMNLIKHGHSGDLYRGTLDGGITIAVKRANVNVPCATELQVFRQISHPRFVSPLGHCIDHEKEMYLVYPYMPKRDLTTSFYRAPISEDESLHSLDWITRLKIAIQVAEALSFLHHECNPPLVHRDVRAGSILLDDTFEVRLGSLSSVRAQEGYAYANHSVIARLLRSPLTSTQSLTGSSPATCAYDIFCFGKVLLELVTGKLGCSDSDDFSTKVWLHRALSYISASDKELVTKIVDPSLIVDEDLLEEAWAMAIVARSCLDTKPSKRPPMKYVLKALENPLKVIRQDDSGPAMMRTTNSSRISWNFGVFESWRHSSSENGAGYAGQGNSNDGFRRRWERMGSQSSGGNDPSSNEISPESVVITKKIPPNQQKGDVAQMVKRSLSMREVRGSIPRISTASSV